MRCLACDRNLTDFESTRKHTDTGEYLDLCNKCYNEIQADVETVTEERLDLTHEDDIQVDWEQDE